MFRVLTLMLTLIMSSYVLVSAQSRTLFLKNSSGRTVATITPRNDGNGSILSCVRKGKNIVIGVTDKPIINISQLPPVVQGLMTDEDNFPSQAKASEWNISPDYNFGEPIEPLIATQWHQNWPYNAQCPLIDGQATLTGCGATAMAQLIYYYKSPRAFKPDERTEGFDLPDTTFDFDLLQSSYPSAQDGSVSQASIDEISKLMVYCGKAVNTRYGIKESNHVFNDLSNSFLTMFGYTPAPLLTGATYSADDWGTILYENLYKGHPILYSASGRSGSHVFLCDGYKDGAWFHFNMGWGGYGDGYYDFTALTGGNIDLSGRPFMIDGCYPIPPEDNLGTYVAPMLTTKWGMGHPYNKYNSFRFENGSPRQMYSNSVAVAQILKYYQWPEEFVPGEKSSQTLKELGPATFDYSIMFNHIGDEHPTDAEDEIAKLISYCDYSTDQCCDDLKNSFGYATTARIIKAQNYNSEKEWAMQLCEEMMQGRPVVLELDGENHTGTRNVVIDGYKGGYVFHLNWCNNGYGDGYYDVRHIKGYKDDYRWALIGIVPDSQSRIEFPEIDGEECEILCQLYSLSGTLVYAGPVDAFADYGLPSGIYILRNDDSVRKILIK